MALTYAQSEAKVQATAGKGITSLTSSCHLHHDSNHHYRHQDYHSLTFVGHSGDQNVQSEIAGRSWSSKRCDADNDETQSDDGRSGVWCDDVMVSWCHGMMVSWCHGVMM